MALSPRFLETIGVFAPALIGLIVFAPFFGSIELVFAVAALLHNPPDRSNVLLGVVLWGLIEIPSLAYVRHVMLRRRQAEAREQMAEAYLELQGLTLRKRGDLDAVNPRPGDVPQCVFVRQNGRYTRFFRGDLPIGVRQQLVALPNEAAFQDAAIRQILDHDIPCTRVVHRRVYTFPADIGFARNNAIVRLKPKDKPLLAQLGFTAVEVQLRATFAVVHEGEAVSYCRATELSRALSDIAAECAVFAYPDYRRRGYARQVALAWAHYVQQRGTLLFFSHAADDEICASLAQGLRLIHVFDEVAYC